MVCKYIMTKVKNLLSFIINLILPHSCISCGKFTNYKYYSGLCLDCLNENEEFYLDKNPALKNIIKRSNFDSFTARFIYHDNIAKAILAFKFHDSPEYGKHFAALMRPKAIEIENYSQCIIVPVPVHTKRLLKRKYNQASILSKYLAKLLHIKYTNKALKRTKHTPHQTGQSSKVRKKQLSNAFLANEKIIKGKDIILVDDVFTTGSTVNLCAEELKNKGANKVHVITIAYTQI